jgi:hypothetical protein
MHQNPSLATLLYIFYSRCIYDYCQHKDHDMRKVLSHLSIVSVLFTLNAHAAVNPAELIKVTAKGNPKCVEYGAVA